MYVGTSSYGIGRYSAGSYWLKPRIVSDLWDINEGVRIEGEMNNAVIWGWFNGRWQKEENEEKQDEQ